METIAEEPLFDGDDDITVLNRECGAVAASRIILGPTNDDVLSIKVGDYLDIVEWYPTDSVITEALLRYEELNCCFALYF